MLGIIAKKIGMGRIFLENGNAVPVTYLLCEPNTVVRIKTKEKDNFSALVLGIGKIRRSAKTKKFKVVKEFQTENIEDIKAGDKIGLERLQDAKKVQIIAFSKGKGFQGVMKKFNFSGGPSSHGSHFHRKPGSVGACALPGRVHRGKKLPGRMGNKRIVLNNRPVVEIHPDKNVLLIKGPVPGYNGSFVIVKEEK